MEVTAIAFGVEIIEKGWAEQEATWKQPRDSPMKSRDFDPPMGIEPFKRFWWMPGPRESQAKAWEVQAYMVEDEGEAIHLPRRGQGYFD